MDRFRRSFHTVGWLSVHLVWVAKYRYHVEKGYDQERCRDVMIRLCDSENSRIFKGAVSKDSVRTQQ